jgi:hypothetical protein
MHSAHMSLARPTAMAEATTTQPAFTSTMHNIYCKVLLFLNKAHHILVVIHSSYLHDVTYIQKDLLHHDP